MGSASSHRKPTSASQQRDDASLTLPPLTSETIQRAREGLDAARNTQALSSIQESLDNAEIIAQGHVEKKASGEQRRCLIRAIIRTLFRVKVEYPERIPQVPAILAPNHLSHFDPFLILSEVPASPYYYILGDARTLYNQGWKRQFLSFNGGTIPLDRLWKEEMAVIEGAKADRQDLADLAAAIKRDVPTGSSIEALRRLDRIVQAILARGDGILMFPEGRLGETEGQLRLPLKRGVAIYALRAGVPIVPVGIIGTQDLYFRKELMLRFGEPLIFPQSSRPKTREVQAVLDALQEALKDLLPEDYSEPKGLKLWRHFLNHLLC